MNHEHEAMNHEADDDKQSFFEEIDWDDVAESFIGCLAAGVVLIIIARVLCGRKRRRPIL